MRAVLFGLMVISLSQTAAAADMMRCGDRLVVSGAPAAEVHGVCGEPTDRRSRQLNFWHAVHDSGHPETGTAVEVPVELEEWTYNFGSDQLIRVLHFRNGILADVEFGGYGFDSPAPR